MINKLFLQKNKKVFFENFLKKNLKVFKYIYIKKNHFLQSSFFSYYNYSNIYLLNIISIILMFRLLIPILSKLILNYNNILILENDSRLHMILKKICNSFNINFFKKWNFGNLINWNNLTKSKIKLNYFPELLITFNSQKNIFSLKEAFNFQLYTISIVSNIKYFKLVSFPILGNCDNLYYNKLIILLFYYIIFYSYIGRLKFFKTFLKLKSKI